MRNTKPRPPVAVAPAAISTENVLAVGGMMPRKLREALAAHPDIPRSRIGHTILVLPEDYARLLDRLRVEPTGDEAVEDTSDPQPETVEAVLERLGLEVVR